MLRTDGVKYPMTVPARHLGYFIWCQKWDLGGEQRTREAKEIRRSTIAIRDTRTHQMPGSLAYAVIQLKNEEAP